LKQFLSFFGKSGKNHIEQMDREDIEAFTEDLQDRGLTPVTVSNRLRWVYAFVRFLIEANVLGYELLERKDQDQAAGSFATSHRPRRFKATCYRQ
jgi:site-specific recombinase XerD